LNFRLNFAHLRLHETIAFCVCANCRLPT